MNPATASADIMYAQRALDTQSGSGANLVPQEVNDFIVALTQNYSALLASNPREWTFSPRTKKTKLVDPTGGLTTQYANTDAGQMSLSDPVLGSLTFDLKVRGTLTQISNELLAVSHPKADILIGQMVALAFAQDFDAAFFGSSQLPNAPLNLLESPNIVTINQAGASLAFSDLLALVKSVVAGGIVKNGPYCFFASPHVFCDLLLPMTNAGGYPVVDLNSTNAADANSGVLHFKMLGFDLFVSAGVPNNMGASTNQSYIAFGAPSHSFNLISMPYGIESAQNGVGFDTNSTQVRGIHQWDIQISPGVAVLENVK
ncbi:MAG TPA: phage major capsid protein [Candidatus Acidoferrales bacterium]|nr:phage major capsid protein [Candidatus Acidoferrales bacterium]